MHNFLTANIGITYKCNFKCLHCYSQNERNIVEEFDAQWWKKTLTLLEQHGVMVLVYAFGESLLRRDFFEISSFAKDLGLHQILMTNGYFVPKFVNEIKNSGINRVFVSIDSCHKEKHDSNRGIPGAFERALESLKTLGDHGIRRGIAFSYDKNNISETEDIIKLAINVGCNEVSLMKMRANYKIPIKTHQLSHIERSEIHSLIKKYHSKNFRILTHDTDLLLHKHEHNPSDLSQDQFVTQNQCHFFKEKLCITANGDVLGCSFSAKPIFQIRKPEDLYTLFTSQVQHSNNLNQCLVLQEEQ